MTISFQMTSLVVFPMLLAGILGGAFGLEEANAPALAGSASLDFVECNSGLRCYNGGSCLRSEDAGEWLCDCTTSTRPMTGAHCERDAQVDSSSVEDERRMFVKPPSLGGPTPPAAAGATAAPSPRATAEDTLFTPPSPLGSEAPAAPSVPTAVIPPPPSTAPVSVAAPSMAPAGEMTTPSVLPTFEGAPASPTGIVPLESDAPSDVPSMSPTGVSAPTVDTPTSVLIPTSGPPTAVGGGGNGNSSSPTSRSTSGSAKSRVASSSLLSLLAMGAMIGVLR